jgi:hypothetical protein
VHYLLHETNRGLLLINIRNDKGHTPLDLVNIQINASPLGGSWQMQAIKSELITASKSVFRMRLQVKQYETEQEERANRVQMLDGIVQVRAMAQNEATEATSKLDAPAVRRRSSSSSVKSHKSDRSTPKAGLSRSPSLRRFQAAGDEALASVEVDKTNKIRRGTSGGGGVVAATHRGSSSESATKKTKPTRRRTRVKASK